MKCPECGYESADAHRFCMNCGSALANACSGCGSPLPEGARFCGQCGRAASGFQAGGTLPAQPAPGGLVPQSSLEFGNGRYQVERLLGEGAVKQVYLAHDTKLDSKVAVAAIKGDLGSDALQRIQREVQSMGRLRDHPYIANIHDVGDHLGQPFIVQEYLEGGSLADALNAAPEHRLPIAEVIRISSQVCQALAFAHAQGIVHRDVKPENVWLAANGTAKLGDFGLAITIDSSRLTHAGTMLGTVSYMPPELAVGGTREADVRCDLYSLGAMTYEMATGRPPFAGSDPVAVISQHISTAPVGPSWHNSAVPKALENLILQLLAKRPEGRPENADVVVRQLDSLARIIEGADEGAEHERENQLDRLAGGVFVGREEETMGLRTALGSAISGEGRLVLLTGEPGIGKTRTAEELATYARLRSAQVLWGRCHEGTGQPPYWPWVQAIRSYVHTRDLQALASDMGTGAGEIAQVITEIRERLPGLAIPSPLEPEQARFRLFDSITTFLRNAAEREPLLIVLDDFQWADEASLLLLQFLAREVQGARLLIVATVRDTDLDPASAAARVLAALASEPVALRVPLMGLSADEIGQYVELATGNPPPKGLPKALHEQADGNPFITGEIVKILVNDQRIGPAARTSSWSVAIPDGVRGIIMKRLDGVSHSSRSVLAAAAVIGREFELRVLEGAIKVSVQMIMDALDEAIAARLVEEVGTRTGTYQFLHAITRDVLYQELQSSRRLELHQSVAECLELIVGPESGPHLGELAYHFTESAMLGTATKAVSYARKAGDQAVKRLAYEDAAAHYHRALQSLALTGQHDPRLKAELLLAEGTAGLVTSAFRESYTLFWEAWELASEDGDSRMAALAAYGISRSSPQSELSEARIAVLEEALERVGHEDRAIRARLCSELAAALAWSEDVERRNGLSDEALELSRGTDDHEGRLSILNAWLEANWRHDRLEARLSVARELVLAGREYRSAWHESEGHLRLLAALLEVGEIQEADEHARAFATLVEKAKLQRHTGWAQAYRGMKATFEGKLDEADQLVTQTLTAFQQAGEPDAILLFGFQVLILRMCQGRLAELEGAVNAVTGQYGDITAAAVIKAFYHAQVGNIDDARKEFEQVAQLGFDALPRDQSWIGTLLQLTEVCAILADAERALPLYGLVVEFADRNGVLSMGVACTGSISHQAGLMADTAGRFDAAERHFEAALAANQRMGARPFTARTQFAFARMMVHRSGPGDLLRARDLIAQSLHAAEEMGMASLISDIVALKLELQGVRLEGSESSFESMTLQVQNERPDLQSHAAPDGTVTLLFTDIVDSTRLNDELGDKRWMEVLREHNSIVRERLRAFRGYEVKTEGDGFMAAFSSARRAIDCAVTIQRAISRRNNDTSDPIYVRAGLHTGEAIHDAGDFFGKHVNLAARIASHAKAGQILVSSLLKDLTDAAGDLEFDAGTDIELKGIPGAQRVHAVSW